jgi:hypothetical protein
MLHRNNKMVWAGIYIHNLHKKRKDRQCQCCGQAQKKRSPKTFPLCIQQQLNYMLYSNNIRDQHGGQ